ncbi:MAG: GntR family transcriptional regulator [Acidobacteria bacterium]|nr:GntR family transcriptional regulator [Acidobacteriota bacterium]
MSLPDLDITLDFRSAWPISEQIKEQLRLLILSGRLPAGEQLWSIRQLAVSLTINPNTVAKVYRELEQEGFLTSRQGKGCFVIDNTGPIIAQERDIRVRNLGTGFLREGRALGFSVNDLIRLLKELDDE